MASQTDLDQGGTSREWTNVYLGPSVGWMRMPARNILSITAAGTYTLDLSTNYVTVNVAGAVIIILPSPSLGAGAGPQPGKSIRAPVTIVDIGGFASFNPITIQPDSVSRQIMGLPQVQITSSYGGFILYPNGTQWTNQS